MPKNAQAQAMPEFQFVQPTATVLQHPCTRTATTPESAPEADATATPAEAVTYPISIATAAALLSQELNFTCNPNTLKSRWLPDKITPTHDGVNCPPLRSPDGKITEFGYQAIRNFVAACIVGENGIKIAPEAFREQLEQQFGVVQTATSSNDTINAINDLRTSFQQQKEEAEQRTSALVKVGRTAQDQLTALQAAEADLDAAIAAELAEQEAEEEAQRLQQSIEIKRAALEQIRRDRAVQAEIKRLRNLGKSPAAPASSTAG
ncbi:hypothetical protein IFO70_36175 [Phormidium tenue FACHB-886]|nr:hypothetical protein [Phormidium tenue FACHB-886]